MHSKRRTSLQRMKEEGERIEQLTREVARRDAEKMNLRRTLIESVEGIDLEAFDRDGKIYVHVKPEIGSEKRYEIQVLLR